MAEPPVCDGSDHDTVAVNAGESWDALRPAGGSNGLPIRTVVEPAAPELSDTTTVRVLPRATFPAWRSPPLEMVSPVAAPKSVQATPEPEPVLRVAVSWSEPPDGT